LPRTAPSRRLPASFEPNAWTARLAERRAAGATLLDLTQGNPTAVGLTRAGAEEMLTRAAADEPAYRPDPRGLPAARAAVVSYYAERGFAPASENVVLTSGTSESCAHLFRLLADPGDAILIPSPSYPLFEPIARLEGLEVAHYRLAYDGAWHLDLASVEDALGRHPRARAVVVVQPNAPTGSGLAAEEIAALESCCEAGGLALISDEVFADFPWPRRACARGPAPRPIESLLGERRVPTFVLGGLSKACGLPQLKLGWIVACGPERECAPLLDGLEWIADLFLTVGTPVQHALPRLLETRHDFRRRVRERIATHLEAIDRLIERRPEVSLLEAAGGWSAILRVPARRSGEQWALDLLDRSLMVHPGHFYDLEGEAFLVLSLIPEPAAFAAGLAQLASALTIP
jgi:aspartate/methionine/tyrosine aminotransferase